MIKCSNCGKEIAEDSQFCEYCGTKTNLTAPIEETVASPKSKKGLITFLVIVLFCCFTCIAWMINREMTYQNYIGRLDTSYVLGEGWTSSNKRNDSSSSKEYIFFLDYSDCINIEYSVSSEKDYDKLLITLIYPNGDKSILLEASGQEHSRINQTVWESGTYQLKVQYKKDGSYSKHSDMASIKRIVVERNRIEQLFWFSRDFFRL